MKNFKDLDKHVRRYIALSILFFIGQLAVQAFVLFKGVELRMGEFVFPQVANYETVFISIAMIIMGIYYFKKMGE